jgi:PhnB protein
MQASAYLHFPGTCEEAFKFYETALGGKMLAMISHEGTPMEAQVPQAWRAKIIHARLQVGDTVLMGSDAPASHYKPPQGFSVNLNFERPDEADRVFAALSEGGKVAMPIQKTFWALRFGMFTDRYGTPWMVNCEDHAPDRH